MHARITLFALAFAASVSAQDQLVGVTVSWVPDDFTTIQAAIDAMPASGGAILVRPGNYDENLDFLGKPITLKSTDGAKTTWIWPFQGRAVQFINGEGPNAILDGFSVRGASPPGQAAGQQQQGVHGGGILIQSASPRIKNCFFTGNRAGRGSTAAHGGTPPGPGGHGGAIAVLGPGVIDFTSTAPLIINCVFAGNHGGPHGGTIGEVGAAGGHGGAIYAAFSAPRILNCTFHDNHGGSSVYAPHAPGRGGAVYLGPLTPQATVTNCIFFENYRGSTTPGRPFGFRLDDIEPSGHVGISYSSFFELGAPSSPTNFVSDPAFARTDFADYRLDITSRCIDAGVVPADLFGHITGDFRGKTRVARGTIDLGAFEVPDSLYGGTEEDLILRTFVPDALSYDNRKDVAAGDLITLTITSPGSTYFAQTPFLFAQLFVTGSPPQGPPSFPSLHLDATALPLLVPNPNPFLSPVIGTSGIALTFQVPPGLTGLSVLYQSLTADPQAQNTLFAATDGHELRVQ